MINSNIMMLFTPKYFFFVKQSLSFCFYISALNTVIDSVSYL